MHAAKALLKHRAFRGAGAVGIILDDRGLKHLLQGDRHSLSDGADVLDHRHAPAIIADVGERGSFADRKLLALTATALPTKDGGSFEDVEIFLHWLKLNWCAALRRRAIGVSTYGLPGFAFSTFHLLCSFFLGPSFFFPYWPPGPRLWSGFQRAKKATSDWRARRRSAISELERARTECAWRIGGWAALSCLSAKDGDAGTTGECENHTRPRIFASQLKFHDLDFGWTGSSGFGRYGRWRAELQLGLGPSYVGADRSCGQHWKHRAVGWGVRRALEIYQRGESESKSHLGRMASFD